MARIEDYALIGDLQTAALVERGRLDRLALLPPLRLRRVLRRAARRARARPLAPRARSATATSDAPLPPRHARARDDVADRRRRRARARLHAAARQGARRRAHRRGRRGRVRDALGARDPLRLRRDRPVGARASTTTRCVAIAGPGRALAFARRRRRAARTCSTVSEFTVDEGERVPFVLTWYPVARGPARARSTPSRRSPRRRASGASGTRAATSTCRPSGATSCSARCMVLKALTYAPTGGIVAAPTTSLPERIGGVRNWDYRYCWLRDATLTLLALLHAGYVDEARAWRRLAPARGRRRPGRHPDHVRRRRRAAADRVRAAVAARLRGLAPGAHRQRRERAAPARRLRRGDRRALPGARARAREPTPHAWRIQRALLDYLERAWREPDEGIWEIRGERRHFMHSKVMAWVAFDRAVQDGRGAGTRRDRSTAGAGCATRSTRRSASAASTRSSARSCSRTARSELDASLLLIPLVGFLPRRRPARARHGRGGRARADAATASSSATARTRRASTACRRARASSSPARSGSPTATSCSAGTTRRARCSSGCSASRNDLGLLSEEYDPECEAAARELPAGVHAPRARQHRVQRRAGPAFADAPAVCATAAS